MDELQLRQDLIWTWLCYLGAACCVSLVISATLSAGACVLARDREASRQLRAGGSTALLVALLLAGLAGALWLLAGAVA